MHNTRAQVITLSSSSDEEAPSEPAGHGPGAGRQQAERTAGRPGGAGSRATAAAATRPHVRICGKTVDPAIQSRGGRRGEARATAKRAVADLTADGQPAASAGRAPKKRAVQAAPARQRPKPCAETAVVLKAEMAGELAALRARYLDAGAHGGTTRVHYRDPRVRELPEEFQCEGAETMDAPARIERYPRIHQALVKFCGRRKRPADADLTELLLLRRLRGWEAGGAAWGEAAPCVDHILGARRSLLGIAPKFRYPRSAPATLNPRSSERAVGPGRPASGSSGGGRRG